jgi:diguanylate cyclase (GGDEF)-like protein
MKTRIRDLLLYDFWIGWRRWVAWSVCISLIFAFGALRTQTDVELAFASFGLLPTLFIAWMGGMKNGLVMAFLAAAIWVVSDVVTDRHFSSTWIPWANAATRLVTYSLIVVLIAEVRIHLKRAREHAMRDVLTGLLNRRAFLEVGNLEVVRANRYKHALSVIFMDLDNFKQLNDSNGHDAGDAALQAVAKALLATLRSNDQVARLGGDEFAVLLPEIGYDDAIETGNKVFNAVNVALRIFPDVTASIGVAWFGEINLTFPQMLKAADELMYEVKANGKGNLTAHCFVQQTI